MKLRRPKIRHLLIGFLATVLLVVVSDRFVAFYFSRQTDRLNRVHPGMSQQEVRALLGKPSRVRGGIWSYQFTQPMGDYGSPLVEYLLFRNSPFETAFIDFTFTTNGILTRSDGYSRGGSIWELFDK